MRPNWALETFKAQGTQEALDLIPRRGGHARRSRQALGSARPIFPGGSERGGQAHARAGPSALAAPRVALLAPTGSCPLRGQCSGRCPPAGHTPLALGLLFLSPSLSPANQGCKEDPAPLRGHRGQTSGPWYHRGRGGPLSSPHAGEKGLAQLSDPDRRRNTLATGLSAGPHRPHGQTAWFGFWGRHQMQGWGKRGPPRGRGQQRSAGRILAGPGLASPGPGEGGDLLVLTPRPPATPSSSAQYFLTLRAGSGERARPGLVRLIPGRWARLSSGPRRQGPTQVQTRSVGGGGVCNTGPAAAQASPHGHAPRPARLAPAPTPAREGRGHASLPP